MMTASWSLLSTFHTPPAFSHRRSKGRKSGPDSMAPVYPSIGSELRQAQAAFHRSGVSAGTRFPATALRMYMAVIIQQPIGCVEIMHYSAPRARGRASERG